MPEDTDGGSKYVVGPSAYRSPHVRIETKPPEEYRWGRNGTGSGYERIRSYEYRPHTPGDDKEDVYVYHHRLLAVAWLLPDDAPLAALDGVDVHHVNGCKWDNRQDNLSLVEHGGHSAITQAELRAWGEDAKADAYAEPEPERCERCNGDLDTPCTSDDWTGRYCIECAMAASEGAKIRVEG